MLIYDNVFAYVYWLSYMTLPCSHLPLISPNAENVIVCLLNALQPHTIYTDFSHVNLTGMRTTTKTTTIVQLYMGKVIPIRQHTTICPHYFQFRSEERRVGKEC